MSDIILRDYQRQALDKFADMDSCALFFSTGSGKTITAIERFLKLHKDNKVNNLLVICPAAIVYQWYIELKKRLVGFNIIEYKKSYTSKKKDDYISQNIHSSKNIVVINYEIAHNMSYLHNVIDNDWHIIADESHNFKNYGTVRKPVKQTHSVLKMGVKTPYKTILTATPTHRGYIDYYSQLNFLGYMPVPLKEYKSRYVIEKDIQVKGIAFPIKVISGYKNTSDIDRILKNVSVSYEPKYNQYEPQDIIVPVEKCSSYNRITTDSTYKDIIMDNVPSKRIGLLTLLSGRIMGKDFYDSRLTYDDNDNKLSILVDFIGNNIVNDDVLCIFYNYNVERDYIIEQLNKKKISYNVIDGNCKDKTAVVNSNNYNVLLLQYKAGSQGLDGLQFKCNKVVFYGLPSSTILYRQAKGRINRIGQERQCLYYHYITSNTIEDKILLNLRSNIAYDERLLDELMVQEFSKK